MSVSDYLRVQADLLIALDVVRRLPLAEFIRFVRSRAPGEPVADAAGWPVRTDLEAMVEIATGARMMVAAGPLARKAPAREAGAMPARVRRA